jgi:CHAD domain-containing protein
MSNMPERSRLVFQKLERDLLKLSSRLKPESVHGFRTGTRRIQTLLEELALDRTRNEKKLLNLLRRIRKRAGKVRDLDVQLSALRSLKIPQEPRRKTLLLQSLIELRAEQEKKLRKALTKETTREVRKRLRRAAKDLNPDKLRDPLVVARQMMTKVVRPQGPPTEDILHQCRIAGKRARYAAEFAVKSPEVDQFIAQLKRAQDALGDWHDWLMLTQSAVKRLGDVHESPLVAVLHNVSGAKFRHAAAALSSTRGTRVDLKRQASQQPKSRKQNANTGAPVVLVSSAA